MKSEVLKLLMLLSKGACYIFIIQLISMQLLMAGDVTGQSLKDTKVTLQLEEASLVEVFNEIQHKTKFIFGYNRSVGKMEKRISLNFENEPLDVVLKYIAKATGLRFKQINGNISVTIDTKRQKKQAKVSVSNRTVTGKVTDEKGEPLPGATVHLKGTGNGTITDVDGNFSLNVPDDDPTLAVIISFVGYQSREIAIGDRSVIEVVMAQNLAALQEVIVIGYGEFREDLLVANVEQLEAQAFENQTNINANQAIQGRLPGVFVTNSSGAPGGATQVVIRGLSSINAGNAPLYVVDGVPIASGSFETTTGKNRALLGRNENLDILSLVNPQDIASIEVLKDAAAKAIYGTRAANGAILITTKSGGSQEPRVAFSTQQGVSKAIIPYRLLNSSEIVELWSESFTNDGREVPDRIRDIDTSVNTDWLDLTLRDGYFQEYQMSVSEAKETVNYYLSANYRNEEGIIRSSDLERTTVRLNLDLPLRDNLHLGTRTTVGFDQGNQLYGGNTSGAGIMNSVLRIPSYLPPRDANGEYTTSPLIGPGPLAMIEEAEYETKTTKLISNNFINWDITPFLTFRTDFSYDLTIYRENFYDSENTNFWSPEGLRSHSFQESRAFTVEPQLKLKQQFGSNRVELMVGFTTLRQDRFYEKVSGNGFASEHTTYLNSVSRIIIEGNNIDREGRLTGSNEEGYSFNSVFGRVNYDFAEKYLVSATFRRDGSSRFGSDYRYGNFWSVGGGWVFSRELFMNGTSFLNMGKLRASYGVTGNDQIGNYPYIGYWGAGNGFLQNPTLSPSQQENQNLKWEELHDFDIGVDLGFLDNRITVGLTYFNSLSQDLLLNRPVSSVSGFENFYQNVGSVRNKGWELDLNASILGFDDFEWQIGANVTQADNRIEALINDEPIPVGFSEGASGSIYGSVLAVGQSINAFFGELAEGVDPATGDIVQKDVNGDGLITIDDRTVLGNPNPRYYGGFNTSLRWKSLRLDANFSFVYDIDVFDRDLQYLYATDHLGENGRSEYLNRWQKPGDQTNIPRMTQANVYRNWGLMRSLYTKDGSYIRLKNITLSYQFPPSLLSPIRLSNAVVYFTGTNLWTITGLEGMDPELNIDGVNFFSYPQTKRFIVGVNLQF